MQHNAHIISYAICKSEEAKQDYLDACRADGRITMHPTSGFSDTAFFYLGLSNQLARETFQTIIKG